MSVKQIFLIGYNGGSLKLAKPPFECPLVEIDTSFSAFNSDSMTMDHELSGDEIRSCFAPVYELWGRFGPFGDLIAIKFLKKNGDYIYFLDFIGRLAFIKPGLAVDLMLFIEVSPFDYFFVGIKRKFDPGKGRPALMGGFMDVHGYHLDTPIETIIQEADKEIGLKIKVLDQNDLLDPLPARSVVNIEYQGQDFRGELLYQGIVPTGDNEKLPALGLKRVYQTTVYSLILEMGGLKLNERKIRAWLEAGDDAEKLVVINLKHRAKLKFGLKHHKAIFNTFMAGMEADDKLPLLN